MKPQAVLYHERVPHTTSHARMKGFAEGVRVCRDPVEITG